MIGDKKSLEKAFQGLFSRLSRNTIFCVFIEDKLEFFHGMKVSYQIRTKRGTSKHSANFYFQSRHFYPPFYDVYVQNNVKERKLAA